MASPRPAPLGMLLLAVLLLLACGGETLGDPPGASGGHPSTGGQTGGTTNGGTAGSTTAGGAGQAGAGSVWPPTTVTLERQSALGFCIQIGQILRAQIVPDTRDMVVTGEIYRDRDTPSACETGYCAITEPLGPTPLSSEQRAELGALVTALPFGDCVTAPDSHCDPCLVSVITVGGVEFVDNPCSSELCPGYFDALRALQAFFDRLVSPGG